MHYNTETLGIKGMDIGVQREVACELITELLRGVSFEEFPCDILGVRFSCR